MNSRKILSFMLAVLMAAGALISCGSETETPADTANTTADTASETTAEPDPFDDIFKIFNKRD